MAVVIVTADIFIPKETVNTQESTEDENKAENLRTVC
jgi:hypothetical protein